MESKWWHHHKTPMCLHPLWSTARDDSTRGWYTEGLVGTLPASHHSIGQEACGAKCLERSGHSWGDILISLISIFSMWLHLRQVRVIHPIVLLISSLGPALGGCLQEPPLSLAYLHQPTTSRVRAMTHTATPYKPTNSKKLEESSRLTGGSINAFQ